MKTEARLSLVQSEKEERVKPETKEWRRILSRFVRNPGALIGGILVLLTVICAVASPLLAPFDPLKGGLSERLAPPSFGGGGHWLGADAVGRDLLSRIIYGARISLFVGIASVAISTVIGVAVGLVSGYFGGWIDDLLMRIGDIKLAFPFILLAILVMAVFGTGIGKLIFILGITGWVGFARVVRGQVLTIKELEYVQAARSVGGTHLRILRKHILPNVMSPVIVLITLNIATNILLEAGLTFLGLGVDPVIPSWGGMLSDGRMYVTTAWWVATFPGIAIMLTVLGFNLLGDWLRDELDPNLKV
ncbi:ABC transporter permease [Paenibacillus humicola]|uniref:ABC transporter permease n=1 Tax=Paenibacillus humicola TaxID=3110540 RepID=UPI00237BCB04|nr:ABC transporter permease [Paenibacillus humicola]